MKLQTLKPGIGRLNTKLAPSAVAKRITGRPLRRRNREVLSANPLCAECQKQGRVRAATQVDHKVPLHLGGSEDRSNLQGLCDDCHDLKSAQEAAQRYTPGG